tara:strand:- start:293 stop:1474 length:1182 start_codon:yes stop_codon:yes gene_type:complete
MNIKLKLIVLVYLFVATMLYGEARVVAAISSMKGNVQIRAASNRKYGTAYKGQMIKTGDWLKTDKNVFVAIVFLDGSNVKIQSNTEIEIKSSRVTAKELKTQMYIAEGQAWSKVSKQTNSEFKIKTPTAVASVKGTEFDVEFDDLAESTTLTVLEGEVYFGNGINEVLAGAMEGATAAKDEEPTKYKVDPKDLPQWQNNTDASWDLKLTPSKTGRLPVGQSMKVSIQVINSKTKETENVYNNDIQISSENELLTVSKDGSTWSNNVNITIKDGRGTVHVKGGGEGKPSIFATAENSESSKLQFEFYISKSQKKSLGGKLSAIASKKGLSSIADVITGKSLKSTSVVSGEANIEDILQKVDTGELEIINAVPTENSDGSVTIKLIIKPRSQDSN